MPPFTEPDMHLPRDPFTTRLRELMDNPAAVKSSSRVDVFDDYGRLETWTIDTFRTVVTLPPAKGKTEKRSATRTTAFVQVMNETGGHRLLMPPIVVAALLRQDAALTGQRRRLGALQALETRRVRGDQIGNPEALRKARKARTQQQKKGGQ